MLIDTAGRRRHVGRNERNSVDLPEGTIRIVTDGLIDGVYYELHMQLQISVLVCAHGGLRRDADDDSRGDAALAWGLAVAVLRDRRGSAIARLD
jgi:hypothetical protein